jgi:hypothetical protein
MVKYNRIYRTNLLVAAPTGNDPETYSIAGLQGV